MIDNAVIEYYDITTATYITRLIGYNNIQLHAAGPMAYAIAAPLRYGPNLWKLTSQNGRLFTI